MSMKERLRRFAQDGEKCLLLAAAVLALTAALIGVFAVRAACADGGADADETPQTTANVTVTASDASGTDVSGTDVSPADADRSTEPTEPAVPPDPLPEPEDGDMVPLRERAPGVRVDLRYATENNFTGQVIYDFTEPLVRYSTAKKLAAVQRELEASGLGLLVWDAYRPVAAQQRLWEVCPDPRFVSDPSKGYSGHCRGNTVDVTLVRADGSAVGMPSGFDDFSSRADRDYSDVSEEAAENARLLERVMEAHGFKGYSGEWWHYSDTESWPVVEE